MLLECSWVSQKTLNTPLSNIKSLATKPLTKVIALSNYISDMLLECPRLDRRLHVLLSKGLDLGAVLCRNVVSACSFCPTDARREISFLDDFKSVACSG